MMGSMDEEQTAVEVTGVEVAGKVYNLPRTFSKTTEGVNFELAPNYTRRLEDVSVVCEEDTFFNDEFSVESSVGRDGDLSLKFSVNSEVKEPALWSSGSVSFNYDAKTKAWSMTAMRSSSQWAFCRPDAAISAMVSALECLSGFDNVEALKTIRDILVDNKAAMLANAPLYTGNCNVTDPDPAVDNSLGTHVPY
jgi:hypothetical protein